MHIRVEHCFELDKVFNIIEHKHANTSLASWLCSFLFHRCELIKLEISLLQVRSLEEALAGALRRESTAGNTIKELQFEIEQLNELVISGDSKYFCIPTDKIL